MKRKMSAPRNPFVAVARFKKAGAHGKSSKALRRAEKMELRGCSSRVEHPAFNRTESVQSAPPLPAPSKVHFSSAICLKLASVVRWQSGNADGC